MALGSKLPCNSLYVKSATLLTSQSTHMSFALEESSEMSTTYSSTQNAMIDEATGDGLVRSPSTTVEITTTTVTDDTCRVSVIFTAASTSTIHGHAVCSTASTTTYDMYSFYCYAASIPIESGDTLTCTNDHKYQIGV